MKLASLRNDHRDGALLVVSRDLSKAALATDIAPCLQAALQDWDKIAPRLNTKYLQLNAGELADTFALDFENLASPLPRPPQFLDGSAYLAHVERVRRARGAEMPPSFLDDPLMYQAVSDGTLGPREAIVVASEEYGIDFEAEVAVIVDDTPMGISEADAGEHIQLIMLVNDVSLRNLIPAELGKGFGFLHSKPRSAFSPVAVSPDELGEAWKDYKVHLPMRVQHNGTWFGHPEAGEDMQFSFARLIAHAAKTRPLAAGSVVGSGTVANQDESRGASCLAERRMLEIIANGKPSTPFMSYGDTIRIEMTNKAGESVFGAIDQTVQAID